VEYYINVSMQHPVYPDRYKHKFRAELGYSNREAAIRLARELATLYPRPQYQLGICTRETVGTHEVYQDYMTDELED